MPSLDEMLAAIAQADEGDEDTEAREVPSAPQDNRTLKDLRGAIKRLEKAAKSAEVERDELRLWKEERVAADNAAALAAAGLSPRQAEVFLKSYGTPTPENVEAFKREVLGTVAPQEPQEEFTPTGPSGFAGQGERPPTKEELKKLAAEDADAALALLRSGKVQLR